MWRAPISASAQTDPDCAEPVIGRRFAPTRWLHPGYSRYCKVLAAALARMRRYRSHHPHRSCGWLRQAKAAESLIAVPAFYFPAVQPRRMGGAKRYPSIAIHGSMGFAKGSTHPTSYELLRLARKRNLATRPRQNNPTGKSPRTCPDLRAKIFRFRRRANHCFNFACLTR